MRATERTYTGPRRRLGAWRAGRPGEVVDQGGQPWGTRLGSQGPDQGFALRLARAFRPRLRLGPGEQVADVVVGCVGVALKRAALFGRAPVADDLEVAFGLFGFLDEPLVGPALAERRRLFAEVSHHHQYTEVRRIVDLVPDATLGLTRQEALDARDAGRAFTPDPVHHRPSRLVIPDPTGPQKGRLLDSVLPVALFLVLNRVWGLAAGVAGATLWSIKVAVSRRSRGEVVGRFLPILVAYLVVRAGVGIWTDSEAVYFGIGIGTKAAIGLALIGTVVRGRPILTRYASVVVPFSAETQAHPGYHRVMARLTVLLGVYQLATSIWDVWLFNQTSTDGYVLIRFVVGWPAGTVATMAAFLWADRALRVVPDYPGLLDLMERPDRR